MKQINKVIGIIVVLAVLAAIASASVPAKLTLTTDKGIYNWSENRPQVIIYNAGNTVLDIRSATLQITNDSGVSIYRQKVDIDILKPRQNYTATVRLNKLLPAGEYKAVLVYSLSGSGKTKYTVSSNAFVVAPSLTLTTMVNGAKDVRFMVTNPGTQAIDISKIKMQVCSDKGAPLYSPFSICPSCDPLQPNKSIKFGWGVFGGIPAGTYQGKMMLQTSSNGVLVINGDTFEVE